MARTRSTIRRSARIAGNEERSQATSGKTAGKTIKHSCPRLSHKTPHRFSSADSLKSAVTSDYPSLHTTSSLTSPTPLQSKSHTTTIATTGGSAEPEREATLPSVGKKAPRENFRRQAQTTSTAEAQLEEPEVDPVASNNDVTSTPAGEVASDPQVYRFKIPSAEEICLSAVTPSPPRSPPGRPVNRRISSSRPTNSFHSSTSPPRDASPLATTVGATICSASNFSATAR